MTGYRAEVEALFFLLLLLLLFLHVCIYSSCFSLSPVYTCCGIERSRATRNKTKRIFTLSDEKDENIIRKRFSSSAHKRSWRRICVMISRRKRVDDLFFFSLSLSLGIRWWLLRNNSTVLTFHFIPTPRRRRGCAHVNGGSSSSYPKRRRRANRVKGRRVQGAGLYSHHSTAAKEKIIKRASLMGART